jgi:RNA polymerase sigma-70 factor (ECF subfamily)
MDFEQTKKLFESAKNGDTKAQNQIYLSYFDPVFRYIFVRVRHQQETEDLAQTVFLKFYGSLERFTLQKEPLAYLFTIARNTVIDYYRQNKIESIDCAESVAAADTTVGLETNNSLLGLLDHLEDRQRDCLILKFIQGYRTEEIAKIMRTTAANVRQIQCRALKRLRQLL